MTQAEHVVALWKGGIRDRAAIAAATGATPIYIRCALSRAKITRRKRKASPPPGTVVTSDRREDILAAWAEGMDLADIALVTGLKRGTVNMTIQRAREQGDPRAGNRKALRRARDLEPATREREA